MLWRELRLTLGSYCHSSHHEPACGGRVQCPKPEKKGRVRAFLLNNRVSSKHLQRLEGTAVYKQYIVNKSIKGNAELIFGDQTLAAACRCAEPELYLALHYDLDSFSIL